MNLPPLTSLRFFNVAAQTMSFAETARQLCVTQAAVSRQIRLLEQSLGVELFDRRNRAVFLNGAGRTLHDVTAPMFEQLERTVYRLRQGARHDLLVVSCEPTVAMMWLITRLPDFQKCHPHIEIRLLTAGGAVDFSHAGVDLAIRRNDFRWGESVYAAPICDEWVGPVCAPHIQWGSDHQAQPPILVSRSRPMAWQHWLASRGTMGCHSKVVEFEHFFLCIRAAVAGQGVTIASRLMVDDELESGQLVAPCGFSPDGSSYILLSPRPLDDGSKEEVFYHWIVDQAGPLLPSASA